MGAERAIALCESFSGVLDFQLGHWDDARRSLEGAVARYERIGSASGEALSRQRLGVLLTALGHTDEAVAVFDAGLLVAERAVMRSHCLTRLHASMARNRLAAGDLEGAEQSMRLGQEAAERHGHCVTCNALLLPEAVRVAVARGRTDEAEVYATSLESSARDFGGRAWSAMSRQAQGRVQRARGKWGEAARCFADASEGFTAMGSVYDAARCELGRAAALREEGASPGEADAIESEARAVMKKMCAKGDET